MDGWGPKGGGGGAATLQALGKLNRHVSFLNLGEEEGRAAREFKHTQW